jgi:hypothetical protein
MKRKAIFVIALLMIMPNANASGIRSANGQSQSAWNATPEYQNFQCPAETSRGEGVDMNFTTDRSDDYYFVNCSPIVTPVPAPVISNTETSTVQVTTPVSNTTVETTTSITSNTQNTVTNNTITQTSTFDWTAFMSNFATWFNTWFANWFNNFFMKWLGL